MSDILDTLIADRPTDEDPTSFVAAARARLSQLNTPVLEDLLRAVEARLGPGQLESMQRVIVEKSGRERWDSFSAVIDETGLPATGPTLLPPGDLDVQLKTYFSYVHHVNDCWRQARDCFQAGRFSFSAFFSVVTLEETGKLSTLWMELLIHDAPRGAAPTRKDPRYHHGKKHFMAMCQGALVNNRLDRLLGVETVKRYLGMAESGSLETFRQSCLYAGVGTGAFPNDDIGRRDAQDLCILSGEVMADVLGNFPWEWKRMLSEVVEFERIVGAEIATP